MRSGLFSDSERRSLFTEALGGGYVNKLIVSIIVMFFVGCGEYSQTPSVIFKDDKGNVYGYYDNTIWMKARKRVIPKETINFILEMNNENN